jgi:hypothetical protein
VFVVGGGRWRDAPVDRAVLRHAANLQRH